MANTVQKFMNWLATRRNFIFSRYSKDGREAQEPERSLVELPLEIRNKLISAVESLPSNPAEEKAIASALNQAYKLWHEDPNHSNNSISILNSPVDSVSRILVESLQEWAQQNSLDLKLLPLTSRPDAIETIKSRLEHYLKSKEEDSDRLEIVVIPNLSWCFLRSLEGLAGIEYLQSLLCEGSEKRFWIIGGGQVAWEYLSSVCTLEAYCGEVFNLPAIAAEDLQQWFEPIINELDIKFDQPRIDQKILDGDKDSQASYFDSLANISQGVGTVAVQLFLKSIRYESVDEDHNKQKNLIAQTPILSKLPNLESADRYLLYSLLLHGDLTLASLAESLGDLESDVQARVQLLRRVGVVEQRDKILKINPIYYPRVKQTLASNNFIINRQ